jgi:hypothetical protein
MMRKSFILFYLFSFLFKPFAQNTEQKILLNQYVQDEKGKKMQSIVAVYKFKGLPLEDPMNIGVETKKKSNYFNAKLPNMEGMGDTSYAYIYFGGIEDREDLTGYTLVFIGNNQRSSKPALFWIDRNHNLDLSDDGAPDTLPNSMVSMDITLINPKVKNATYTINLSRFSTSYNSKYVGMLDDYYKENSGEKKYAGTLFSFKEVRLNTIAGDYKLGNDSFRLGIKDVNCNGIYNDYGTDVLLIGEYKSLVLPDNRVEIKSKSGKTWFERNGKRYLVLHVDQVGAYVILKEDADAKIQNSLTIGKKLKKFKFQTTDKERKSVCIKKYKRKPMYLYVWSFDQEGFSEDTAALRIIERDFKDKIQVLTLNYGETPLELKKFKRINKINWRIGQSTQKINEQLFIEHLPFGLLTVKRLKIKDVKISPTDLLFLLKNNQI